MSRTHLQMQTVCGSVSLLQLRMQTLGCGRGLSADVKFVDPHTSDNYTSHLQEQDATTVIPAIRQF